MTRKALQKLRKQQFRINEETTKIIEALLLGVRTPVYHTRTVVMKSNIEVDDICEFGCQLFLFYAFLNRGDVA